MPLTISLHKRLSNHGIQIKEDDIYYCWCCQKTYDNSVTAHRPTDSISPPKAA